MARAWCAGSPDDRQAPAEGHRATGPQASRVSKTALHPELPWPPDLAAGSPSRGKGSRRRKASVVENWASGCLRPARRMLSILALTR